MAGLLAIGDKLLVETKLPVSFDSHINVKQWYPKNYWQVKHHPCLPTEASSRLALLCGYLWSDGSVTKKYLGFGNTRVEFIDEVASLIKELFGLEPHLYRMNSKTRIVKIDSSELTHYFHASLGFRKTAIPDFLWHVDRDIRKAFLQGVV